MEDYQLPTSDNPPDVIVTYKPEGGRPEDELEARRRLNKLEKDIEECNKFLLSPHDPIKDMSQDRLETLCKNIEEMYKRCHQVRLSHSITNFKVGLDFEKYKQAQIEKLEKRRKKQMDGVKEAAKTESKKKQKAEKGGNALAALGLDLSKIMEMKNMYCTEHKKMKAECGCV